MPQYPGIAALAGAAAAAEITWGTTQSLLRNSAFETAFTFTGLTGISGHEKVIIIVQWACAFGTRATTIPNYTATLNGQALNKLVSWSFNAGTARYEYTQTGILWLDSPPNGDLAFSFGTSQFRILAATVMPLDGAAAGSAAFGTPVTTLVASNSTTLTNSLTTTVANTSWRIGAFGSRHNAATPFSLTDTSLTKVREQNHTGSGGDDLSLIVTRKQNGATGAKAMGGTWAGSGAADDWSSGHSVEVLAA